jgi:hypothetical protein
MTSGDAWGKLSTTRPGQRDAHIAKGAQAIGITNVFVYSSRSPSRKATGDTICVGECVLNTVSKPSTPGGP